MLYRCLGVVLIGLSLGCSGKRSFDQKRLARIREMSGMATVNSVSTRAEWISTQPARLRILRSEGVPVIEADVISEGSLKSPSGDFLGTWRCEWTECELIRGDIQTSQVQAEFYLSFPPMIQP